MRAIHRKLLRDLWQIRSQAVAIVVMIAAGVALFVSQLGTLESLKQARTDFYARYRFADVFVECKRAPRSLLPQIEAMPGVEAVDARIVQGALLEVPGLDEPATGLLISIPDGRQPALNQLVLRRGRLPNPEVSDEVVAIEMFSDANSLQPGDSLTAILNGRKRRFQIVGIVLSPEHVYSIPADGLVPDDRRHGVLWMNNRELASASNLEGTFNSLTLRLRPGARHRDVLSSIDTLQRPYGGRGAYGRSEQISNWFLENEFKQLETFGVFIPLIFLGVASFLLNIVLSRLITTQREQIAALKAFGYSNGSVAVHYLQLVGILLVLGGVLGSAGGIWLASLLMDLYRQYYHFHELVLRVPGWVPLSGCLTTAVAALIGTWHAVGKAASLPPAEAMRPEAPPVYRPTLLERLGFQRWFNQPSRMILRQLERRPLKSALAVVGLSFAVGMLVMGTAWVDIIYKVIEIQSEVVFREDVDVGFHEPQGRRALHELRALPGVGLVEPYRSVPVRIRHAHRHRRVAIQGLPRDSELSRALDQDLNPIVLPGSGVLLSRVLADRLRIGPGDSVVLEVLEGSRPQREVRVAGVVDDFMGMAGYMEIHALNRLLREDSVLNGARMRVSPQDHPALLRELRDRPAVRSVTSAGSALDNLRKMVEEGLVVTLVVNVLFAAILASGIIYNSARVSLSERARELASLRVLGMTRGEISYILLGELALLTALAMPLGFFLGHTMTEATLGLLDSEVMRFPMVVHPRTYSLAALGVLVATVVSGLAVRRRLDRLDLVEVLKSRE